MESNKKIQAVEDSKKWTSIKVEFEHTINNIAYTLPLQKESQGTKRYYGFAGLLALLIKTSTAFPIDELDSSLHPDLYWHFILSFLLEEIPIAAALTEVSKTTELKKENLGIFIEEEKYR